jgi:hypothetical protein
MTEKGE